MGHRAGPCCKPIPEARHDRTRKNEVEVEDEGQRAFIVGDSDCMVFDADLLDPENEDGEPDANGLRPVLAGNSEMARCGGCRAATANGTTPKPSRVSASN